MNKRKNAPEKIFKKSFSQCGEDLIIQYVFSLRGIENPSYIDIGAYDPYYLNNTAIFYEKGCRGINVEPNPFLIKKFQKHRPEDINLNVGIGDEAGVFDFYVMKDSTLSTFSKFEVDVLCGYGKGIDRIERVNLIPLNDVVKNHFNGVFPDFISLDVEGFELNVLSSIDYINSFPKVVCVEIAEYSPIGTGRKRLDIFEFLEERGYLEYANTNLNSIFVKREFWFD